MEEMTGELEEILLDSYPYQEQVFLFGRFKLRLTVRYNTVGDFWNFDLFDVDQEAYVCQSASLVVGVPILEKETCPYFFWLTDESGLGLDPMGGEDLGIRCKLYIGAKP